MGAGRAGTSLALLLQRAGYPVVAAAGREHSRSLAERYLPGARFVPPSEAAHAADVVILGVPDDAIEEVCEALAESVGPGRAVLHLSGSTSLSALGPARRAGALVLSLHPLQTVPDVETGVARLPGSAMAVTAHDEEGFVLGERLAEDAGGRPFRLPDERKPLYHAAAVFCANYLVVVEGLAERLFLAAGVEDPRSRFAPLARASLEGVLLDGPTRALTGPASRGDAGTVRRNLEALEAAAPDAVAAYVVLARAALDLADDRLDRAARARVEEVLAAWS